MAYSSGFSPHPRISYANASPTGAATEAEYLEIGVAQACDPELVREVLDSALPPGLDVLEVIVAPTGALADLLTGSHWQIALTGVPPEAAAAAVDALLAAESVPVERMTKNGVRSFDARAAVIALSVNEIGLDLVCKHQTPLVRPDDVLTAMTQLEPAFAPSEVPILTRLSQGVLDEQTGVIADPFAA